MGHSAIHRRMFWNAPTWKISRPSESLVDGGVAASAAALPRVRTLDVNYEGARPNKGDDEFLRLIRRVDVAVDEAHGNAEETTLLDLRSPSAAGTELESGAAMDQIAQHLAIPVMVPTRRDVRLDAHAYEKRTIGRERHLAE